jgi:iron complex transport system substrate-binding protein
VTNTPSTEGKFVHDRPPVETIPPLDNLGGHDPVSSRRIAGAFAALVLAAGLAACGSSDGGPVHADQTTSASFPVTIKGVTIASEPKAIVSLSPSATETLFAIGAGSQVTAVDLNSNYPTDAPKGDLDAYKPNVEAIADKEPDLVVVSDDLNDVVKGLTALKIPVLVQAAPTDLDGVYADIRDLGRATGHADKADAVATRMKNDITGIVNGTDDDGVTYYYELDNTFYTETSKTFLGKLLAKLGLVNIADGAEGASDYPQLSAEHIIKSDPDLILLADTKCCQQSISTVKTRPGWSNLKALSHDGVVELDDDVASRWGPRLVELLRTVASAAKKVKSAS